MKLGVVDPNGSPDRQIEAMDRACRELGFFRIPTDVVDRDVRDRAWQTAAAFFALDDATKRAIEFPEPGYPHGYSPFRTETLAKSLDDVEAQPDLKESLSVGPDCGAPRDPVDGEAWILSPSLWPAAVPELRPAWTAYYRALSEVAEQRAGAHSHALRAGAHSDYGTFTILRTDKVPGLEIVGPNGEWVSVEPDPDFFVVNLGDTIAQWTNDRWRSTLHRVLPSAAPRQSFAFFHMANWDARIECLPTCLAPGETPRHEPVQAGPWLMRKFQSTVV